jgi:SAM-dependent methyltransferase
MKSYLKTSDFFLSKESFELLHDDELDLLTTHPKPEDLAKYYESANYISHSDGERTVLERLYQRIKKINLQRKTDLIKSFAGNHKKLLDVGAGTGDFLLYAKRKGWDASGVEPNPNARRLSVEKGIELKTSIDDFRGEKFRIITLWHVLEHLPNLNESIESLSHLLEDDGTLFVAVPNFKSYDAKYYGPFWAAYDVPRHLWHFSKGAIERLFGVHKIKLIKAKPMWFDSFYVSLLSEEYKTGKKNWIRAVAVGLYSNLRGIFTKEFSSHIYILQKGDRAA